MSDLAPNRAAPPPGKQYNVATGELEDANPLSPGVDPADQRRLSQGPGDASQAELNDRYLKGEIDLDGNELGGKKNDIPVQASGDKGHTKNTGKQA